MNRGIGRGNLRLAHEERPLDGLVSEILERPLSRRTLLRRGRDLGLTLAASSFLTACGSAVSAHRLIQPPRPDPPTARYLVVLIIDAGRPDYLDYADLPNIKHLMSQGTYYDRAWVGQLEAVTPASHATIGSGCFPSSDGGILGFWWEDPDTGTTFNSVPLDGSDPDSLAVILADANAPTMAEFLKRHDSRAKVYAASGQKFYAADAAGGPYADYISYYGSRHGVAWAPKCIDGYELPNEILHDARFTRSPIPFAGTGKQDTLAAELALEVIRRERPRIVILNLPEMDWPVAHLYGGPLTPGAVAKVMQNVDRILGDIVGEYESLGILHETTFMLLGDHGVTPLERSTDAQAIKNAIASVDPVVSFDPHTAAFGWIENVSASRAAATAVENAGIEGVSAVYYLTEVAGRRAYAPAPNTAAATRGAVDSAYRYLLQTTAGDNCPHVVCFYPERTGTQGAGGSTPWLGDHGGPSWASQAVPLVISGPGVRKGHVSHFPARLADLAPTAMRLLSVPYPRADGIVLADALTSPLHVDTRRQAQVAPYLDAYAAALKLQSKRDTAGMPSIKPQAKSSPGVIPLGPTY